MLAALSVGSLIVYHFGEDAILYEVKQGKAILGRICILHI